MVLATKFYYISKVLYPIIVLLMGRIYHIPGIYFRMIFPQILKKYISIILGFNPSFRYQPHILVFFILPILIDLTIVG